MIYVSLGDTNQAMNWLETGYEERFNPGVLLAGLRSSPLRLALPKPCAPRWPAPVRYALPCAVGPESAERPSITAALPNYLQRSINSGGINPTAERLWTARHPCRFWRATTAFGSASGQVLDPAKDGKDDFLLHVGMHLGGHGADCSMRACARRIGARFRGGRAHSSPG